MRRLLLGILVAGLIVGLAPSANAIGWHGSFVACQSPITHATLRALATKAHERGCDPTFLQYRKALSAYQNEAAFFTYLGGSTNGVPNTTYFGDYVNNPDPSVTNSARDGFLYGARYFRWTARNDFAAGQNDATPFGF